MDIVEELMNQNRLKNSALDKASQIIMIQKN